MSDHQSNGGSVGAQAAGPELLRAGAVQVVESLQRAGFQALWAGGCVRDMLMGRVCKDYDIATSARPQEVQRLFPGSVAVGKAFGVVIVMRNGMAYEVATFRQDHGYRDGRHPNSVSFTDAEHDARRRDFTINALFFDPVPGKVLDYVGGRFDIERRVVRCVGEPRERFAEDHLRMMRAVRFAGTLDFAVDSDTARAIAELAPSIARISIERVQQELTRTLLESRRPGDSLRTLDELGLLRVILPEIVAMRGQAQPPQFHPEGDVFTHTVMMLNAMRDRTQRLAYAALLHDVAKPVCAAEVEGRIRFDGHSARGAEMAEAIMRRLRLPLDDIRAVCFAIANHMRFMEVRKMRRSTLLRLVGAPTFPLELELHRLDCLASHGDLSNYEFLQEFQRRLDSEPVLPEPFITGQDIMALGVPEGPDVGNLKRHAYEAQLEGRLQSRDQALEWLRGEISAKT